MSRRLTDYEGFSVRRKYNGSGFNPFSDFFDQRKSLEGATEAPGPRSKDLVVLFNGTEQITSDPLGDLRNDLRRDLEFGTGAGSAGMIPLFPGANEIEIGDCVKGEDSEDSEDHMDGKMDSDMDMLVAINSLKNEESFPFTRGPGTSPFTEATPQGGVAEDKQFIDKLFTQIAKESPKESPKEASEELSTVPMVQPRDKTGQRLLYKYPSIPMVGGRDKYYLLVGQTDKSDSAWLMQFDGAANPNPGPASSGAVLWSPRESDGKRRVVFEMGKFLGRATNNIAEAQGLLLGLKMAALRGARELLIEGDSELIVFQQIRKYQVKDKNLKVWWAETQAAMMDESSFDWIAIRQVPREFNERADSITKEVLGRKEGFSRG